MDGNPYKSGSIAADIFDQQRPHLEVDDGWYSCRLAENWFGNSYPDDPKCDCGADKLNARLRALAERTWVIESHSGNGP